MKTTFRNDSGYKVTIRKETISPGGMYVHRSNDPIDLLPIPVSREVLPSVKLTAGDLQEFSEVRICQDPNKRGIRLEGILPRNDKDRSAFVAAKNGVSSKIKTALKSRICLKKLLEAVKICPNQCNHLVQTYVKGIQKISQLYSRVAKDSTQMWYFYKRGTLTQLYNYLDKLEYMLCDAKDLLKACAKELGSIALVVSMPNMPLVEKDMEVCSNFDLLFRELMWNLDLITNELQPADVQLEWCPNVHRYVLKPRDGSRNVVAGETSAEGKPGICEDVRSLARKDRQHLLSSLESGSISIPDSPFSRFPWQFFAPVQKDRFNNIIIERCKLEIVQFVQSSSRRSLSVDPKCFRIDHLDLKPNTRRVLGHGSYKKTYEGKWCG